MSVKVGCCGFSKIAMHDDAIRFMGLMGGR